MKENSKGLEIASCIIAIIVGALFIFMGISSSIAIGSSEFDILMEELFAEFEAMGIAITLQEFTEMFRTLMIMFIVVYFAGGITLIVLPSFILKRVKNEVTMRKLRKAYTIVTGVAMFLMFFAGIGADVLSFILLAGLVVAFILENMFLNKNKRRRVIYITPAVNSTPSDPFAQDGSMPDIFSQNSTPSGMPDIFAESEKKSDTLDSKISDLKRLKDTGVITEEQYAQAVEKIIREESNK